MVERGWWLVWCFMYSLWCRHQTFGLPCSDGEFYNGDQGECFPCTRCHNDEIVIAACYVYRDTVCKSATSFLEKPHHLIGRKPTITLPETSLVNYALKDHTNADISLVNYALKVHTNAHELENETKQNNTAFILSKNVDIPLVLSKKPNIGHDKNVDPSHRLKKKHHRHRHGEILPDNLLPRSINLIRNESTYIFSELTPDNISQFDEVVNLTTTDRRPGNDNHNSSLKNHDIVILAVWLSAYDAIAEEGDGKTKSAEGGWLKVLFITASIILGICLGVLLITVCSHLRDTIARRKRREKQNHLKGTSLVDSNLYIENWQQQDRVPTLSKTPMVLIVPTSQKVSKSSFSESLSPVMTNRTPMCSLNSTATSPKANRVSI